MLTDELPQHDAEALLGAWGAFCRREADEEVGLPSVCPSCAGYEAPPWPEPPPRTNISAGDVERACWTMLVMRSRYVRLHRDAQDHYRDGARIGWRRAEEIKDVFSRIWTEWNRFSGPTSAL